MNVCSHAHTEEEEILAFVKLYVVSVPCVTGKNTQEEMNVDVIGKCL